MISDFGFQSSDFEFRTLEFGWQKGFRKSEKYIQLRKRFSSSEFGTHSPIAIKIFVIRLMISECTLNFRNQKSPVRKFYFPQSEITNSNFSHANPHATAENPAVVLWGVPIF